MVAMHEGQWDVAVETVERLVAQQFPRWQGLSVTRVLSGGTVNSLFRLGDEIVLRFSLFPTQDPQRRDELLAAQQTVATVSGQVAVHVPVLMGVGEPGNGYPGFWSAYGWIPGQVATPALVSDLDAFAVELAGFIEALHGAPTDGRSWDGDTRGGPLVDADARVRECIAESARFVDPGRVQAAWDECVDAPRGGRADAWIHADLMPSNLLVRGGRLAAVIDWEMVGIGDPAVDLMPAWNFLPAGSRDTFRRTLQVDDDMWSRGRGWALCQAIVALPYYAETNKVMADTALRTLAALLD